MGGIFGGKKNNTQVPRYTQLLVQTSSQGVPIPIVYGKNRISTNLLSAFNFQSYANKQSAGKGGGASSTSYNYRTGLIMGLCEGPINGVYAVWEGQTPTTLSTLYLTLYTGTATQTPPSFMTTNYPTIAQSYALTAYVYSSNLELGSSPQVPNYGYEVGGFFYNSQYSYTGQPDVNPADFVYDYLTSLQYGVTLPSSAMGDMTQYRAYCQAQGIFMSPALVDQEQVTQTLARWAQLSNSWFFWSGNQMKFVPLGDAALSANGATYTPQLTPIYNLTLNDFTPAVGDVPVTVTRSDPTDGYNNVQLNINDRGNYYNNTPIYWWDQNSEDLYGVLPAQEIQASEICLPSIGMLVATLIGQRACYIRNNYSFKTSYTFILLEPGDIVSLTEPNIGLNQFAVRITSVQEDQSGVLTFTAEELPYGVGTAPIYSAPASLSSGANNLLVLPSNVNAPCIFEPTAALSGGPAEIWIYLSGASNWGGANVSVSFNGSSYTPLGSITTSGIQGSLTASLAAHADPDSTDTLSIDCTESEQFLPTTATHADADAFRTLILIDNELMSYGTVTQGSSAEKFNLTYLRRGLYGTPINAHIGPTAYTTSGDTPTNTSSMTLTSVTGLLVGMLLSGPAGLGTGSAIEAISGSTITLNTPTVADIPASSTVTFTSSFTRVDLSNIFAYDLPSNYTGSPIYFKFASFNQYDNSTQAASSINAFLYTPAGVATAVYPPTIGTAVAAPSGATVSWTPNSASNTTYYQVYYNTTNNFATATKYATTVPSTSTAQTLSGLTPSTVYYFWVVAGNAALVSLQSGSATCTTGPAGSGVTNNGTAYSSITTSGIVTLGTTTGGALVVGGSIPVLQGTVSLGNAVAIDLGVGLTGSLGSGGTINLSGTSAFELVEGSSTYSNVIGLVAGPNITFSTPSSGLSTISSGASGTSGSAGITFSGTNYPNIVGSSNITFTGAGGTLTASSSPTISANSQIQSHGTSIGLSGTLDFAGGMTVAVAGGVTTISTGGGGGGGGGALTSITSVIASGSPTEIDLLSVFTSVYDTYLIELVGFQPAANGDNLVLQFGNASGPTWETSSNYYWGQMLAGNASSSIPIGAGPDTSVCIFNSYYANAGSLYFPSEASLRIKNPKSTTLAKSVTGYGCLLHSSGGFCTMNFAGSLIEPTTTYDSFRVLMSSSSITNGTVTVYGIVT